jgi:hypothetical protein
MTDSGTLPGKRFSQGVQFQTEPTDRQEDGRILVASGSRSRNRDWDTNKPYRLMPSGMRFDAWAKTGLVLYMHNFHIPLGKGSLYLENGQLWAPDTIDFHRRVIPVATQNWIGDAIGDIDTSVLADLWDQRYLNSVSIHVMFTPEDELNIVETAEEILIPTSEVVEFSVVTIPGDREANRERMLAMGLEPGEKELCLLCDMDPPVHTAPDGSKYRYLPAGALDKFSWAQGSPNHSKSEVDMDNQEQDVETTKTDEEEVAEETPIEPAEEFTDELAEEVEGEVDFIDVGELVEAIANDPEARMTLAQALANDREVVRLFIETLMPGVENVPGQLLEAPARPPRRIRFVSKRETEEPTRPTRRAETKEPVRPTRRDPKRASALTGMFHPK